MQRKTHRLAASLAVTIGLSFGALTSETAAAGPSIGLAIGTKAPPFELVDQSGAARSFESLGSRGKLAIVFYRSADW